MRQDHIPRGRTIPMGAVPILARGLGHTAPTYLRRRPGSPSNGLLGPALLFPGSAIRSRPCLLPQPIPSPAICKSELRRQALDRRRDVDRDDARRAERAARRRRPRMGAALAAARRRRLLADPRRARLRPLLAALQAHGFATALPVVARPLGAARLPPVARRRTARCAASLGVPEPGAAAAAVEPDLLFVPLAAFDRRGHRIGYGAGHYDRALKLLRASGPDPRRRRRLCGLRRSTPRPTSRTTNGSISSSPSASGSTREAAADAAVVRRRHRRPRRPHGADQPPAGVARALAARFRRRQRRERRRRLRHHRDDLRGVPRRRRRRDHARQPRLRSARGAGVHRAPAAADPPRQLPRRHARARRQSSSRPRPARGCW